MSLPPEQKFKYGDVVDSMHVRWDAQRQYHFCQLDDIQDDFPGARRFKVQGSTILFLVDENGRRIEPNRIAHYPNDVVEIITSTRTLGSVASPTASVEHLPRLYTPAEIDAALNIKAEVRPPAHTLLLPPLKIEPLSGLSPFLVHATGAASPSVPTAKPVPPLPTAVVEPASPLSRLGSPQAISSTLSTLPPPLPPNVDTSPLQIQKTTLSTTTTTISSGSNHSPSTSSSSISSSSSASSHTSADTSTTPFEPLSPPAPPTFAQNVPQMSSMAPRFSERFSLVSINESSLATEIAYINRLISRASDRKSEYFGGLLKYFANLILQQRQVFGQHARGDTTRQYLQQRTQELQHQTTIAKLDVMDRKLDAILVQSYELHEYTIPRFFVVLPESLERWDSKSLAIGKYRLYFLCECDAHSSDHYKGSPTGGTATASFSSRRRVHLANHPGYSFSRPTEFLQLYGPYALGMLKILRCCLRASTIVPPAAGLANEAIQDTMQGIESIANNTMENIVSNSISFFKQKLKDEGIIKKLSTTPSGPDGSNQHNGDDDDEDDALQNVVALEGADLRRLRTFLRYSDTDRTLGNLYRTTTREGHVKWVCLRHYRTSYQETKMANFLSIVRVNKGTYDPHLRKVTVSLASSTAAKNFFETLANQAPAVDELEVVLDWSFRSSDLETLVKSINQSNVRILNLDLKDFVEKRSKFRSIMLPGKGKYHPLLELLWNKNLQGLSLSGAGGFGLRTSDFPMGQHFSSLRSLHFLNVFKGSEQLRLMKILSYCPNLTDLRMGDYIYWSKVRKELVSVIGSMTNLQTLHLYGLRGESGEPVSGILNAFANKGLLKELVCYSGRANELELGNVIRKLSRTLEVLIVDQMTSPYLDLVPTLTTSTTTGSGQATESTEFQPNFRSAGPLCAPYSRLTHLDLKAHLTPPSLDYLAKALKDLNLVHLGLTATTKALLSHVNFSTLKSLSLLNFEEPDMQPLLGFILTSSNQCQFDTLSLLGCTFTNPRTFAPLLGPLTLKRLQMSVLPSAQLKGVLGTLNLSRLEALVLVHCQYDWAAEEILAVKRKEFTPELTLHLSISDEYQVEGIHRAETRGHTDTQVRLAGRRVRLYSGTHLLLMDKPLMGVF